MTRLIPSLITLLMLSLLGCAKTDTNSQSDVESDNLRAYEPFRAFYDIPCKDASDMIIWDMTRLGREMKPEDYEPYIFAYGSRYRECEEDQSYVDNYLGLLEAAGLTGEYNRVFAEFQARFPDQRNRTALSDSAHAAPGSSR